MNRDNFTCQRCGQFNPELGSVALVDQDTGGGQLHEYINCPNPYDAVYRISQMETGGLTFNINFGDCWPVFPVMQVHHKRYVNGRESWDYGDDDLITLCKRCHTRLHSSEKIPICSTDGIKIEERMFLPIDQGSGRKHNAEEWTFIKKIGHGEYVVSDIHPTTTMVLFADESQERAAAECHRVLDGFMKRYFPRYATRG